MKRPRHLSRNGWEGCWKSSMDSWGCERCIVGDRYPSGVLSFQFGFIASGCLVGPLTPPNGAITWPFRPWDFEVCTETSLSFVNYTTARGHGSATRGTADPAPYPSLPTIPADHRHSADPADWFLLLAAPQSPGLSTLFCN